MERVHRVVVAYASVGSGHRMAAEAICARSSERGLPCTTLDMLDHGRMRASGDLLAASFTGPTAPLYDRIWRREPRPGGIRGSAPALAFAYAPLLRALREMRPEVVVCTHAMPAIAGARWRVRGRLDAAIACVLTDFQAHSQWPLDLDAYCVASQRAHDTFVARGVAPERIVVTGIPLRPAFDAPAPPMSRGGEAGRRALIVAGAVNQGVYRHLAEALPGIVRSLADGGVPVTVVAGGNDRLRETLAPLAGKDVEILGFVDDMPEVLRGASLFLGKPGGLVCAEALSCSLPMVLVGPAYGQERANAELLVDAGAAVHVEDPARAAAVVTDLLRAPSTLEDMRAAAASLHRPQATEAVLEVVSGLVSRG